MDRTIFLHPNIMRFLQYNTEAFIDLVLDLYVVVRHHLQQLSTYRAEDAKTEARILDREARSQASPGALS